jgi:hypothetical protein
VLQDFLYSVAEFLNARALQFVGYAGVLYVIRIDAEQGFGIIGCGETNMKH